MVRFSFEVQYTGKDGIWTSCTNGQQPADKTVPISAMDGTLPCRVLIFLPDGERFCEDSSLKSCYENGILDFTRNAGGEVPVYGGLNKRFLVADSVDGRVFKLVTTSPGAAKGVSGVTECGSFTFHLRVETHPPSYSPEDGAMTRGAWLRPPEDDGWGSDGMHEKDCVLRGLEVGDVSLIHGVRRPPEPVKTHGTTNIDHFRAMSVNVKLGTVGDHSRGNATVAELSAKKKTALLAEHEALTKSIEALQRRLTDVDRKILDMASDHGK